MVTGVEAAVVFLIAWFARKAGRVGKWVDGMADEVLDAYLKKLHEVVATRLPNDSALEQLAIEAAETGDASVSTRAIVQRTLTRTTESDPEFAAELDAVVEPLRAHGSVTIDRSMNLTGDVTANDHGIAIGQVSGEVSVPRPDPRLPGRS